MATYKSLYICGVKCIYLQSDVPCNILIYHQLPTIMIMPSQSDAEHVAINQPGTHCNGLQTSAGHADLFHLAHKVLLQKT